MIFLNSECLFHKIWIDTIFLAYFFQFFHSFVINWFFINFFAIREQIQRIFSVFPIFIFNFINSG